MLTSDLLRVRRHKGTLKPRYLGTKNKPRLLPVAEGLVNALAGNVGRTREEVEAALDDVPCAARDRMVQQGLRKLLLDRCDFGLPEGHDPIEVRREVFLRAAARRRELDAMGTFEREAILTDASAAVEMTPEDVEARLFADLKGAETLEKVRRINGAELLDRYDVASPRACCCGRCG